MPNFITPPVDTSAFAKASDLTGMAKTSDLTGLAKTADLPLPATTMPPGVADSGALGSSQKYALENHTHASRARKARIQTGVDGSIVWTFSTPFDAGVVPRVVAVAEVPSGTTDVVNVQVVGTPTNTGCTLLVNRTNRSTVALLGLTILSLPSQPGATWVHAVALEP